ncbi:hypothetical protein JCM10212_003687 [Sporobolomyces blumeae]
MKQATTIANKAMPTKAYIVVVDDPESSDGSSVADADSAEAVFDPAEAVVDSPPLVAAVVSDAPAKSFSPAAVVPPVLVAVEPAADPEPSAVLEPLDVPLAVSVASGLAVVEADDAEVESRSTGIGCEMVGMKDIVEVSP